MNLNRRAWERCERLLQQSSECGVTSVRDEGGSRLIDCGLFAPGGLAAGLALAEICLADLGSVALQPNSTELGGGVAVAVQTDHPLAACMAAQYAGWQVAGHKFFAMGSGPMRAARGTEAIFDEIGWRETSEVAVGVLETAKLPPVEVCERLASECHVAPDQLTLLIAPTRSLAGSLQVVARSVETALHKLHTLHFDLKTIRAGYGVAPLPPLAADDLAAIGRTNDAVLYGGQVTLWVDCEDDVIDQLGAQVPSGVSRDYGVPFQQIFERYERDFYRIDPLLFSPAVVTFVNLRTGRQRRFGQVNPDVLATSFGS